MEVPQPMFISARLMAALKIDGVGQLEVGDRGRWRIEDAEGNLLEEGGDLRCPMADDWGQVMASLLSFLTAVAESYRYRMSHPDSDPENLDLFSEKVAEWAYMNDSELQMAEMELEER